LRHEPNYKMYTFETLRVRIIWHLAMKICINNWINIGIKKLTKFFLKRLNAINLIVYTIKIIKKFDKKKEK